MSTSAEINALETCWHCQGLLPAQWKNDLGALYCSEACQTAAQVMQRLQGPSVTHQMWSSTVLSGTTVITSNSTRLVSWQPVSSAPYAHVSYGQSYTVSGGVGGQAVVANAMGGLAGAGGSTKAAAASLLGSDDSVVGGTFSSVSLKVPSLSKWFRRKP